ncbi:MAG: DUF5916 domain-containing protein [Bacteroidota bacterium]
MRASSCSLFFLLIYTSLAQNLPDSVDYFLIGALEGIQIDGKLDEPIWREVPKAGGFYQTFPTDDRPALDSTQFMITYTDKAVIIGVICYDYLEGEPISTTLQRDFDWGTNDNISFYIDSYNDKTNGFAFQLTPNNVQREGLVLIGGSVRDDWDNKWYSGVQRLEDRWTAEISIPFKTLRYNTDGRWNLQVLRNNQKRNERTSWIQVPQGFQSSNLTFSGSLIWDKNPRKAGPNIALIPYVAASAGQDFENEQPIERDLSAGFDAKVGVSSSLNLDLTFNPDFSQVDVDQQVTNLQRFELFFPERRQFFLENQDLFAEGGFGSSRPFFSRRIGLQGAGDTRRNVPIIAGARLSGKIGSKWRIGALNMITDRDATSQEISPAQNYSLAVIERNIIGRSFLSATFVGRNNLGQSALESFSVQNDTIFDERGQARNAEDTLFQLSKYNYVFGVDYNIATADNRWEGDFFYHRSLDPGESMEKKYATGGFLRYRRVAYALRMNYQVVGENHNAEVGFIPRTGIGNYGFGAEYNFFPKVGSAVQRHGPNAGYGSVLDSDWNRLDNDAGLDYEVSFLNTSYLEGGIGWNFVTLTDGFDPSGTDGLELESGESFSWIFYRAFYRTDRRKNVIAQFFTRYGDFYNGQRFAGEVGLTFRFPPILQIQINGEYNAVRLPEPFNDSDLLLLGPRIDLTLNNNLFLTTFVQLNTQEKNLGHNTRLQWRFKPVSDVFLVYTDNYITDGLQTLNRAIVFKVSYWLNL